MCIKDSGEDGPRPVTDHTHHVAEPLTAKLPVIHVSYISCPGTGRASSAHLPHRPSLPSRARPGMLKDTMNDCNPWAPPSRPLLGTHLHTHVDTPHLAPQLLTPAALGLSGVTWRLS